MAFPTATRARSGEGSGAAAEPGRAGQLGDKPVTFSPAPGHPAGIITRVRLTELSIEALQAVPVLRYRLVVEDRLGRTVITTGPAAAGQPGHQVGRAYLLAQNKPRRPWPPGPAVSGRSAP